MKRIAAMLLVLVLIISLVGTALAETTASGEPKYTLTDVKYDGKNVTGKLVHTDGTPVFEKISVRVTFFIFNNFYMATSQTVKADGTFSITGVGPIEYITALARGVNADGTYTRIGAAEIVLGQ
jgi:hypothetical protein